MKDTCGLSWLCLRLSCSAGIWSRFCKMWVNLILKGSGGCSICPLQRWHFILLSQSRLSVYSGVEFVILSLWYHKHSHSNRLWCHRQKIYSPLALNERKKNFIVRHSTANAIIAFWEEIGFEKLHFNSAKNVLIKSGWTWDIHHRLQKLFVNLRKRFQQVSPEAVDKVQSE